MPSIFATLSLFVLLIAVPARAASRSEAAAPASRPGTIEVTGGAALAIGGGSRLVGAEAGFGIPVLPDLGIFVGGDLGAFVTTGPFAAVFTAFPQAYRKWAASPTVFLRAGLALGPVVATGGGLSAVRFGAWLKPGLDAKIDRDLWLNFEPKVGFIGSSFVFVPQLGVTLAL